MGGRPNRPLAGVRESAVPSFDPVGHPFRPQTISDPPLGCYSRLRCCGCAKKKSVGVFGRGGGGERWGHPSPCFFSPETRPFDPFQASFSIQNTSPTHTNNTCHVYEPVDVKKKVHGVMFGRLGEGKKEAARAWGNPTPISSRGASGPKHPSPSLHPSVVGPPFFFPGVRDVHPMPGRHYNWGPPLANTSLSSLSGGWTANGITPLACDEWFCVRPPPHAREEMCWATRT